MFHYKMYFFWILISKVKVTYMSISSFLFSSFALYAFCVCVCVCVCVGR